MIASPGFLLDKWYLDCVTPGGDVFIGYTATLRWRRLRLNYASVLLAPYGGAPESRTTLRASGGPELRGGELTWSCTPLVCAGRWHAEAPELERTLLQDESGQVRWSCLQPRSACTVAVAGRPPLSGLGYAERLSLTVKPWRLPLRELRWGRFLSPHDTVVWIEWRGLRPLSLLFHNGVEVDAGCISDDLLTFADSSLRFADSRVLRQGPLVRTALAAVPALHHLAPRRILEAEETKWCSRGELLPAEPAASTGWAIHEVVAFPMSAE